MTLVRAIGRTMLSSYFVLNGIRAVRNPSEFVADAEPLAERIVPTAKRFAPEQVAGLIPEDTATLVRLNGAAQVIGGVALASGKGRRLGAGLLALSLIPATVARHPFWSRTDREEKTADRQQFVKNLSLLGGVIIASRDTEGKPGIVWRANEGRELAVKRTKKAKKDAKKAIKRGRNEVTGAAVAGGLALVEEVVAESRKARRQAAKQAKAAAERAQVEAKHARKQARKSAKKSVDRVQKSSAKVSKKAQGAVEDATKSVRKIADDARTQLGEHIELGNN
ncbi:DoxX family membrane protein [Microlunatus elymi]|uniref:DoxX family membrane protein n=1 Tax=Microlunatus elymi TaxID=2596828 RepID=A0A516Q169_9ACTN|nr:DoxX family membrane protein [Microlunatus elymi]QDP97132.1 DoxX family membrane protein [Microlunatus elymi]